MTFGDTEAGRSVLLTQVRGPIRAVGQGSAGAGPRGQLEDQAEVGVDVVRAGIVEGGAGVPAEDGGQVAEAAEGKVGHEEELEADQECQGARPVQESAEHGAGALDQPGTRVLSRGEEG